jgi:hypothetical protein
MLLSSVTSAAIALAPMVPAAAFGGRKTDPGRASDHHDLLAFKHHDVPSAFVADMNSASTGY